MSLQPTWMMTFLAQVCFAKRLGAFAKMSATLAPGKQYVTADLLLTCLIIESPITSVLGEAGGGDVDSSFGAVTEDRGWMEESVE